MRPLVFSLIAGLLAATPARAAQQEVARQQQVVQQEVVQQQVVQQHLASSDPVQRVLAFTGDDRKARVLNRPARLEVEGIPLHEALGALHQSSGVPIVFSPSLIPSVEVTCRCESTSVRAALDRLLRNTGTEAVASGGQIVIAPRTGPAEVKLAGLAALPVPSRPVMTVAEERGTLLDAPGPQPVGVITGRVQDARSGQPVASVQVYIAGLDIGVLTQQNGRYLLQDVPAGTHTLTAERIGYRTVSAEVTIGDGETVVQDFTISEEALQLDEVIVTGTPGGTQRRAIGNSVGQIDAAEISDIAPVMTMQDMLGPREPGLQFHRGSGNIGTGSEIRIRGVSSLSLGHQPLIYVDGVRVDNEAAGGPFLRDGRQVSTLDDFSPEEIESIEIIKGPAAATLYGTEASAGVIQIITKRGETGAPRFDLSIRQGGTWLSNLSEKVGTSYGRNEAGEVISFNIYEAEKAAGREHFQTGHLQSYTASMRGGTDNLRYYLSADFGNDEGIVDYNWQKKTNLRANVSVVPSDAFTLDVNVGYVMGKTSFMQQRRQWGMWEQFQWSNPEGQDRILRGFLRARPEEIADNEAIRDMTRFTGSATLTHNPTEWLTHKLVVGTDVLDEKNSVLFPRRPEGANHDFGDLSLGFLNVDRPHRQYNSLDYAGSLIYELNQDLQFTTSVGFQYYSRTEEISGGQGRVFPAPPIRTLSGAATTTSFQSFVENKSAGVYVQEEVNFRDRIFLTGAVRGDDNSAFGADFDAAIYPKFSATWVVSDEDFWQGGVEDWVNSLRLRSAWGQAGRQPETFAAVTLYQPQVGPVGLPAVSPNVLGNRDLGPEVSSELEIGFDAAFLDDRLSAEFTYYSQTVKDALVDVPVSPISGFSGSQSVNLGQVSNWGWELLLDGRILERSGFAWDMGVAFTSNENRVDDLAGQPPTNSLREGRPYPFISEERAISGEIDPETKEVVDLMCDGGTGFDGREPGGEPVACNLAPPVRFGNGLAVPKYDASVNTTITLFDNLRLYAMAEWRGEHYRYLVDAGCRHHCFYTSRAAVERPAEYAYAIAAIDGLIPPWGRYTYGFNGAFAKLREVSANYRLPSSLSQRIGASRASINVAARNLWTIWVATEDVAGAVIHDPEARRVGSLTTSNSNVPPLTNFVVTMRVSF